MNKYAFFTTNLNQNNRKSSRSLSKSNNEIQIDTFVVYTEQQIEQRAQEIKNEYNELIVDIENKISDLNIFKILSNIMPNKNYTKVVSNELTLQSFNILFDSIDKMDTNSCAVYGSGNLGRRIARSLLERNQKVSLISRNPSSETNLVFAESIEQKLRDKLRIIDYHNLEKEYDIHIGCTSGIAVIEKNYIFENIEKNHLIDVGRNNFTEESIELAELNKNFIHSLSIDEILLNWISLINSSKKQIQMPGKILQKCGHTFVRKGIVLKENQILVDNPSNVKKIFGKYSKENGFETDFLCNCNQF